MLILFEPLNKLNSVNRETKFLYTDNIQRVAGENRFVLVDIE